MKKALKLITCTLIVAGLLMPSAAYAREGECGYEGGISSQVSQGKTSSKISYEYSEVCFITGEPVIFKGTLTIAKSVKQGKVISTYVYNLVNTEKSATLTRTIVYNTNLTKKDNGQTIEETTFDKTPAEVIKIGNTSYVLKSYSYTRTSLMDPKPAVNYFSGNIWGKKVYQVGTTPSGGTVEIEVTGKFYGYDQYWSNTETEILNYTIQSNKGSDKWGGTATVTVSSSSSKQLKYVENEPDHISFDGGYVQTQQNNSVLEYEYSLPEFDSKGISTDNMITSKGSLKLETFPAQTWLPVTDLNYLRGHWAENDIKTLFSLEIFKDTGSIFNPDKFITRAEFASALVNAAKAVPPDPSTVTKTTTKKTNSQQQVVSPFVDVAVDSLYFKDINDAFTRGILYGKDSSHFAPNEAIKVVDAITLFIKTLGLENMAPGPNAVTSFKDNDKIPSYARSAVYVAEKIGLVRGDDRGYLNPNDRMTKARAAVMLNKFIEYMRNGIGKDYREHVIDY